jgi:hypothetical protein
VCLTVPFIPHAWAIYPEIAGAAIVAWTVAWSIDPKPASLATWLVRGSCLAALPWLHTKFIVFLATLTVWLLVQLRARLKESAALLAPIAVSVGSWLAFFYVVYGTLDPEAPYGGYTAQFVRLANVPRSLLGILFDQKFGLFVYAPIYLLAPLGGWLLLRDRRWRGTAAALVSIVLLYSLTSARLYMWWGGSSAPARFLVPLIPLVAPALAAVFSRMRGLTTEVNVGVFALLSVLISASGVLGFEQGLLFSDPHGSSRIVQALQGSAPLASALPTFTDENWLAPLARLLPWLAAAGAALAIARVASFTWRPSRFALIGVEGAVFLVVAAALAQPFPADVRADSVTRGHLALMTTFDPRRLRAFDYSTGSKLLPPAWLSAGALSIDLDPSQAADEQGRLAGPLSLPPGRYDVTIWFQGERSRDGDLMLALGRTQVLSRLAGPLSNPAALLIDLPLPVPQLWVQLTERSSAQDAVRVEIAPVAIVPVPDRPRIEPRAAESIPFLRNAYMVYADDWTFPEGGVFWTRGTSVGEVFVAPEGGSELLVTLHVGPASGAVHLAAAGEVREIQMAANETRTISMRVPSGAPYVPVSVEAPGSFRPADVDPSSSDTRSLGCQVRVEVR